MPDLYPLRFHPVLRRYLWGGRRLGSVLGKTLGPESDYAESWEIVDRRDAQSIVANGPLAGAALGQMVTGHGAALLGKHHPQPRFPLLLKFLDAQQALSVQVHPDDARAARLDPPDLGKTEAWVILAVEPESYIYAGLKPGVQRAELQRAIDQGDCERYLHRVQPRVGDCFFIPPGIVHALGPGLLVAEIQQSSDTTYRLFDWNRLGADGRPRALHVEQALEAIDYRRGPVEPLQPRPAERPWAQRLVECDKFVLNRCRLETPQQFGGDNRCRAIAVLSGAVEIGGDPAGRPLEQGSVALLPASLGQAALSPQPAASLLEIYLP